MAPTQVIEHNDLVSGLQKLFGNHASDVARSSCYQNPHSLRTLSGHLSGYLANPVGSRADVDFRFACNRALVAFGNLLLKSGDAIGANQRDRAAPKTASRHAHSVNALHLPSQFHHQVEFRATHLKIVAQTVM